MRSHPGGRGLWRACGVQAYNGRMRRPPHGTERYGYLLAAACVAAATALFYAGRPHFAKGQWALLYLLVVGLVAGVSGVRPALAAGVLSFFAWNYFFLPPYGTLHVADLRDWLSLFVFLVVALLMGAQTGRLREREARAVAREQEAGLLNQFSAHLVSDLPVEQVTRRLVTEVQRSTGAPCVALFLPEGSVVAAPAEGGERPPEVIRASAWVADAARAVGLPGPPADRDAGGPSWPATARAAEAGLPEDSRALLLPLRTPAQLLGVLYVGARDDGTAYTYDEARTVVTLTSLVSVFLERVHLQTRAVQADALREADQLKSTLFSAVSHELKTPLASLKATLTNLLEQDASLERAALREELQAMEQDVERLAASIDSLLDLARLEASAWGPHLEWYELGEILGTVLSRLPARAQDRVTFSLPPDLPLVHVDFDQWGRVLEHLLRNALDYSGPQGPVRVGASATGEEIRLWVEDEGPGLAPEEHTQVFEKFYRGRAAARVPSGTGLGLAITREIVRFHGGRVWAEAVTPHGARFVVTLPSPHRKE